MKKVIAIICFVVSNYSFSQDSLSVLFLGNSYTYVNDLPGTLSNLTQSLGDKITYDSQAIGGATFQTHVNTSSTYSKIKSKQWDFVVLQGQSQEPSFPFEQVNTNTIPYAIQLADSVYANKFCSQVMMYMTWGRQNGDPQWDSISTFNGMNDRLRSAYLRIMDSVQGSISPVGSAWRYVRDHYPAINLYSSDGSHPSPEGTYLAACTFYASLFRKSPVGASFLGSVSQTNATILQNVAALTVLDSLDFWNLQSINDLTLADFTYNQNDGQIIIENNSLKANEFEWDFGDGSNMSTALNPVHTYFSNGDYSVKLIASSPCDSDTLVLDITINSLANDASLNETKERIYKLLNFENNHYRINFSEDQPSRIQLYNSNSKLIYDQHCLDQNIEIDLSNLENGIYLLKIQTEKSLKFEKILKSK